MGIRMGGGVHCYLEVFSFPIMEVFVFSFLNMGIKIMKKKVNL